jgi:serine/threonine-protein kinase
LSVSAVTDEGSSFQIGRYEIRCEIGRGTMGVVYEAYDPSLRRTIALKTFHLSFSVSPQRYKVFEQRFFAEAQIAARFSHPGIVAVHDVGCDPEIGTLYIALEYLEGRTLQEVIEDGVPLGWREALRITRRVAEALHYAHSQQVVHRDIKPANIMLLPCGDPKILDFGIAKMEARSNLTTACQVFGTPLFMAPEQALGKKPDGRADLFSLGAIAYTLLTGRLAFEAPSIPATVRRVVNDDPEPPSRIVPDLPQGVDEIIARVLAKSPKDRYSCGRALAEDIQTLLDAPRTRRGQLALGLAGDAPPTHSIVDVDAELAALVSSPAAPADSVPATSPRGTPRPLRFVLPALLAVLSVCYLALHGPAAEGPAAPASAPLSQPAAADPARAKGPGTATPSSAAADDPPSQVSVRPLGSASTLRNNRSLGEPARPRPTPVSLLPKRRTPGPASTSNNRLSTSEPARVRIDFEHPLRSGKLRLWIDEEMVLQQELEGREATKVLKLRKGRIGREIAVKPGERTVRVQVRWDDNEREQSLSGKFESGAARQLDLKLGRFRKNLSAEWK